jgi:hypothetical protein
MALIGETAGWTWALNDGDEYYTATWDLDFGPRPAFFKVALDEMFDLGGSDSFVMVGLVNIRRRLANGEVQQIDYPFGTLGNSPAVYDDGLMHVTYGMQVRHVYAKLLYTLGYWG